MSSKDVLYMTLMSNLPADYVKTEILKSGEPGEELLVDEASVWKRILDYRVAKFINPISILETHAGLGVASSLYKTVCPDANIISCKKFETDIPENSKFDYIDIDPYGQPYKAIKYALPHSNENTIWSITNREIMQVSRNLKGVYLQSDYKGKDAYLWVEKVFIPYLEKELNSKCQFYYIFPTSVRVIMSNKELPKDLFSGCPVYMSYIQKYVNDAKERLF